MRLYRLYQEFDGVKMYLSVDHEPTPNRAKAGWFTERDWQRMDSVMEREEIGEDEKLRVAGGAPMLPGMEAAK